MLVALDVTGSVAEAKLAARRLWECPFQPLREPVFASLCKSSPSEAFKCAVKLAEKRQLSHASLQSLLTTLVHRLQTGKLFYMRTALIACQALIHHLFATSHSGKYSRHMVYQAVLCCICVLACCTSQPLFIVCNPSGG